MDFDIRIGDEIRTDSASRGFSDTGIITAFDDDDEFACTVDYIRNDDGKSMPIYVLIHSIIENLSADRRDAYFHKSIEILNRI